MRKDPAYADVYNDLDHEVVNVFRVLRDREMAADLERQVRLTPWSRHEFDLAMEEASDDPIESARRTIYRAFAGFGTTSRRAGATGFRARPYRTRNTGVRDWLTYPDAIASFVERMITVTIEERQALEVIGMYDSDDTLFYCDPPYPRDTRSSIRCDYDLQRAYRHEMTDDDHRDLARALNQVQGMAIISSYPSALYDELYADWTRVSTDTLSDGARPRTECLWISPAALSRRMPLFEDMDCPEPVDF